MPIRDQWGRARGGSSFSNLIPGGTSSSAQNITPAQLLAIQELRWVCRLKDDGVCETGNPGNYPSSNIFSGFTSTTRYQKPGAATTNTVGLSGNPGEITPGSSKYPLYYTT